MDTTLKIIYSLIALFFIYHGTRSLFNSEQVLKDAIKTAKINAKIFDFPLLGYPNKMRVIFYRRGGTRFIKFWGMLALIAGLYALYIVWY